MTDEKKTKFSKLDFEMNKTKIALSGLVENENPPDSMNCETD